MPSVEDFTPSDKFHIERTFATQLVSELQMKLGPRFIPVGKMLVYQLTPILLMHVQDPTGPSGSSIEKLDLPSVEASESWTEIVTKTTFFCVDMEIDSLLRALVRVLAELAVAVAEAASEQANQRPALLS